VSFLVDGRPLTAELLSSWLSSSVRPSVRHGSIVAKRCEIGPRLLLIANRKWYALQIPNQIRWKSLTLNNLEGRYALLRLNGA